ncbi:MAG TPA: glycosyltransferase [Actinophytocola sp.]|nr:glycosyltransferase [Actinophytocola sp.]
MPTTEPTRSVACTIVARNFIPAAKVLARSYLEHHPGAEFVVAVIDGARDTDVEPGVRFVGPDFLDLDRSEYLRMATSYTLGELASAVKPLLLRRLLDQASAVVFLQPDIQVFAPLTDVEQLVADHHIVLTPRFTEPLPRDGREPDEAAVMGAGMFDLGFIAVGPGAKRFLDFWKDRTRQYSIYDPGAQVFVDQRWVDQVPTLFEHTILRDPGVNVAYWNLHERPLARGTDGRYHVGPDPLRLFHFSGYRPDRPWLLTQHCQDRPRVLLSEYPEVERLCDAYRAALLAAGYESPDDAEPYGYDRLADGTRITTPMRRLFRDAWLAAELPDAEHTLFRRATEEVPPHPFGEDGGALFRRWLSSPSSPPEVAAGLNRLTMLVWSHRPDLQRAFPWPCNADAAGFRKWCHTFGIAEEVIPEWALPTSPTPVAAPDDEFGVNVAGYLTAELGLGEMGRIVHDVILDAGIPVASVVEEHSLACRSNLPAPDTAGRPRFPVSLMTVNSDQTELLLASYPEVGHQRYRIGLWAWELDQLPSWQRGGFDHVDEVWTISEFCREAFARHSPVPVKVVPVPVPDPGAPDRESRPDGKPTQFFFAFDFNSTAQRKNPWGAVAAFQQAFPGRDDVRLVIKTTNSRLHRPAMERLVRTVQGDPRIEVFDRYLSVAELADLYRDSDCYVSLHRSEGFGLTVAEAMVRGMPVIATDYSGTTEFFGGEVGWSIPYRTVDVGPGWFPYPEDGTWADPDIAAAASAMRVVADNPAEARRRGAAAREHILRTRSVEAAATWIRTQLTAAYQTWRADRGAPADPAPNGKYTLDTARAALHWRADPLAASRTPLAPALRRVVLRAVDHYDAHQRRMIGAVVDDAQDAINQVGEDVARSMTRRDERLDGLQAQLDQIARAVESLTRRAGLAQEGPK